MSNKDKEVSLAQAMVRLAEAMEKVTSPDTWRTIWQIGTAHMEEGLRAMQTTGGLFQAVHVPTVLPTGQVESLSMSISLTPEAREELANTVLEAVKPELAQFQQFVGQAIKDLPEKQLQEAARRVKAGRPVTVSRKAGCIFLDFPEPDPVAAESFYLKL